MTTYKFIEEEQDLVKDFISEVTGRKPFPYFIAVGAFEEDELKGILTIGKPGYDLNHPYYTYAPQDNIVTTKEMYDGLIHHFHTLYDGLIQGIDH